MCELATQTYGACVSIVITWHDICTRTRQLIRDEERTFLAKGCPVRMSAL
jgi:hypothetical protein